MLRKTISGIISFLLLSTFLISLDIQIAKASEYLQIVEPKDGFVVSGAFQITFRIINAGNETIVFAQGDYKNRIDLEVGFDPMVLPSGIELYSWGTCLWSTVSEGLTLKPGESFTKSEKCEIGVYYGRLRIQLVHWQKKDDPYTFGDLGRVEAKGRVPQFVTEADIGFYRTNALSSSLASYLKSLGYSITYVNSSNFASVKLVYMDYRSLGALYAPSQEDLLDYVSAGGSLWIDGEAGGSETNILGAVISEDGVEFWGDSDDPSRLWMRDHPLTKGVSSIVYPAGAWLRISGAIEDIMRIDDKVILAVDQSRPGKIVWLIDSDIFGRYFLYEASNNILAKNIVRWVLGAGNLPDLSITEPLQFLDSIPRPFLPNVLKIRTHVFNDGAITAENVVVKVFLDAETPIEIGVSETKTIESGEEEYFDVVCEFPSNVEDGLIYAIAYPLGQEDADFTDNIIYQPLSFYFIDFRHDRDAFSFPNPYYNHRYEYFTEIGTVIKEVGLEEKNAIKTILTILGGWVGELTAIRGHCFGMASASTVWYINPKEKPLDKPTHMMSWNEPEVKARIILYQWRQVLSLFPAVTETLLFYNAKTQYDLILRDIKSGEPAVLAMGLPGGHAVTAYKILDLGDEKRVYIYENEIPLKDKKEDYYVKFNISSNEGKYPRLNFDKVIYVPKKLFVTPLQWSDIRKLLEQTTKDLWFKKKILVWKHSAAEVLFKDEHGRIIGYINGTFINEVPGAEMEEVLGTQLFHIPLNLTYSVQINGTGTGTLGIDAVVPISDSKVKVVSYVNISITPSFKAIGVLSGVEVLPFLRLETEVIKPTVAEELDVSEITFPTDLNKDGRVNIMDIAIVAKAFGSKPGDPNWNEIADLDKNEIINIIDISMVAKDFGKSI